MYMGRWAGYCSTDAMILWAYHVWELLWTLCGIFVGTLWGYCGGYCGGYSTGTAVTSHDSLWLSLPPILLPHHLHFAVLAPVGGR